jgi:hypothetical protein
MNDACRQPGSSAAAYRVISSKWFVNYACSICP